MNPRIAGIQPVRSRALLSASRVATRHAAIQLKPRDTARYFSMLARYVGEAARTLAPALHKILTDDNDYTSDWLKHGSNYDLDLTDFDRIQDRLKLIRDFAESMREKARDYAEASGPDRRDLVYYAQRSTERFLDDMQRSRSVATAIRKNQPSLVDALDDWRTPRQYLDIVNTIEQALTTLFAWLDDARGKLGELVRAIKEWSSSLDGEAAQPASEDVEVLYHTSINARAILSKGFDPHGGAPNAGLGGSQTGISFTYDLHIAKEILRCLREAILIANGDVIARDIYEWARAAHILDKVQTSYEGLDHHPPDDPVRTLTLYQSYLTHSTRYNPMFYGTSAQLYSRFHGKTERDVGILACHVNVKIPGVEYYPAEKELRVPPSAVVSVDRLIS